MTFEGGEHCRHFVSERDWHGLLEVASASHWCVAVFSCEGRQTLANAVDVFLDEGQCLPDLHNGCRVGDVLSGGAPVRPFAESVLAQLYQLLNDRQDRVANPLSCFLEFRHVDLVDRAMANDFGGRLLRDDAEFGLRARECRLEVEIFLHAVLV